MYGFKKNRKDRNCDNFSHPIFIKGGLEQIQNIKRKSGDCNRLKGAE